MIFNKSAEELASTNALERVRQWVKGIHMAKARNARFLLLIALSAMITACSTVFILGWAGPASRSFSLQRHLPAAALILVVLFAMLAITGLLGDLSRGIAIRADGTRNIGAVVSVIVGMPLGAIMGGFVFQFMAMLAD